jgi:HemY protein
MIKLIFFLILATIFAVLISFIVESEGSIIIQWIGYRVDINISSAIILIILLFIVLILLFFVINKLFSFKSHIKNINNKKEIIKYKKAMNYLSDGFIAIVADNIKGAEKQYIKAYKLLKNQTPVNLLRAQIEYLKKNYAQAAELFRDSKKTRDNELDFIASKLYLQNAKKENNQSGIIRYSGEVLKSKPKNENALALLLKAYRQSGNAQKLEEAIIYAEKHKSPILNESKEEIGTAYVMIAKYFLKKGSYKKALIYTKKAEHLIPDFLPVDIITVKALISLGRNIRATMAIKKAWKKHTHPELLEMYLALHSKLLPKKKLKKVKELCRINPDNFESHMAMSRANFEAKDFTNAKEHARSALDMRKTESVYKLLFEIEKTESPDSRIVNVLSDKMKSAKKDYQWKCEKCGEIENEWSPNCKKCGKIDTIKWNNDN